MIFRLSLLRFAVAPFPAAVLVTRHRYRRTIKLIGNNKRIECKARPVVRVRVRSIVVRVRVNDTTVGIGVVARPLNHAGRRRWESLPFACLKRGPVGALV